MEVCLLEEDLIMVKSEILKREVWNVDSDKAMVEDLHVPIPRCSRSITPKKNLLPTFLSLS